MSPTNEHQQPQTPPSNDDVRRKLIVDACGIFKDLSALRGMADEFYTTPAVLTEIKDDATRQALTRSPVELNLRRPSPEAIKHVMAFAKKTGDAASLSLADVSILALVVDVEREAHGGSIVHLRSSPFTAAVQRGANPALKPKSCDAAAVEQLDIQKLSVKDDDAENKTTMAAPPTKDDDDDDGWITPDNVRRIKDSSRTAKPAVAVKPAREFKVACMTTDYAMQNVLMQLGVCVVGTNGQRITQLKNWVLRCHACFNVTKQMDKKFCPSCGGATLIRTSCAIDAVTGEMRLFLKRNFQYNLRGTVYSLPAPPKGRQSDLILREDQKEYAKAKRSQDHALKKMANDSGVVDVFDAEYMPSFLSGGSGSAGGHRHVNGIVVGHGRRNPNAVRRTSTKK